MVAVLLAASRHNSSNCCVPTDRQLKSPRIFLVVALFFFLFLLFFLFFVGVRIRFCPSSISAAALFQTQRAPKVCLHVFENITPTTIHMDEPHWGLEVNNNRVLRATPALPTRALHPLPHIELPAASTGQRAFRAAPFEAETRREEIPHECQAHGLVFLSLTPHRGCKSAEMRCAKRPVGYGGACFARCSPPHHSH